MNLTNVHTNDYVVSVVPILLTCLNDNAVFGNEKGIEAPLSVGEIIEIEPTVKHWINAIEEHNFSLIKS